MEFGTKLTYDGVVREGVGLAVGFRHVVCIGSCVAWFGTPPNPLPIKVAVIALLIWSSARLWSRRGGTCWEAADLLVIALFLAVPAHGAYTAEVVGGITYRIAAATIISFGVSLPWTVSGGFAVTLIAAMLIGRRCTPGLDVEIALQDFKFRFLVLAWAMAVGARWVVLRAAIGVDRSRVALSRAWVDAAVAAARRRHEREQWAILHDTAASTLMLIGADAPVSAEQIAAQAGRDVVVLESGVPVFEGGDGSPVDLVAVLAELVRQCRVPVVMDGPAQVWLHPVSAWVVVAAVREALTNVERHASASRVRIALEESRIVVFDNGVGLTGRSDGVNVRHGIRRSIVERMSSIGGSALVTGVAGSGTSVELRWPPDGPVHTPEEPENDTGGVPHLETGLTIAIAGVSIADIGWQLTRLAEHPDPIPAPWVHLLLAIVTVGCATTAIVATNRRAMTTVALMTTVIAISVVLTAWIPESHSGLNWTIGAAGWAVVALGIRGSRETTVAALLVWWIVVCVVVVIDAPTLGMVAHMVYLTVGILYLQIAIVMFASSLHRVVELVASRERQRREVVASHAVETALNQECEQRYRRQLASLLPILRGIADGTVSPKSPEVRSRAQAEYSRLRRLLARVDSMDYPLFADIRDAVDDAEARGVQVVIDAPPDLPELSAGDRDLVAASIRIMLDGSRLRARLTVMAEQDAIDVSVICDIGSTVLERLSDLWSTTDMALTIVDEEAGTVWLRLRCEVSSDQFTTRTDSSIAAASA